jgi:hypothetical protein
MIYKNSYINLSKPILGVNSNAHGMSCLVGIKLSQVSNPCYTSKVVNDS